MTVLVIGFFFVNSVISDDTLKHYEDTMLYGTTSQRVKVMKDIRKLTNHTETLKNLIVMGLNDISPRVKGEAAYTSVVLKMTNLSDEILKVINKEKNREALEKLFYAAGELGIKGAEERARQILDDPDAEVRTKISAVNLLGKLKDRASTRKLMNLLDNPETPDNLREQIALALGDIGDKRAGEMLIDILENPAESKFVRMYSAISIGKIKPEGGFDALKRAAEESDVSEVKVWATAALAYYGLKRSGPALLNALKDDNVSVRIAAIKAIKQVASSENFKLPEEMVKVIEFKAKYDPDDGVRRKAKELLDLVKRDKSPETNQVNQQKREGEKGGRQSKNIKAGRRTEKGK